MRKRNWQDLEKSGTSPVERSLSTKTNKQWRLVGSSIKALIGNRREWLGCRGDALRSGLAGSPPEALMANKEHIALLKKGADSWNAWRLRNSGIVNPDLRGANLSDVRMRDVLQSCSSMPLQ
jgi:hypothetical protein